MNDENNKPKGSNPKEQSPQETPYKGAADSYKRQQSQQHNNRDTTSPYNELESDEHTSTHRKPQNVSEASTDTNNTSPGQEGGSTDGDTTPYDRAARRRNREIESANNKERSDQDDDSSKSNSNSNNLVKRDSNNNKPDSKSDKNPNQKTSPSKAVTPAGRKKLTKAPIATAGGAIAGVASGLATNQKQKLKSKVNEDTFGEEEETDDKPKKDKKPNAVLGVAKKAGAAVGGKMLALLAPKGIIILLVAILIPIILLILVITNDTIERTFSHTQKYGCVEDKFTSDFLALVDPGNKYSLGDMIGDLFSDNESSCKISSGSGFTGEFYPPTIGNITSGWYYTSGQYHGATDIAAYNNAPIFAYAGGEVIQRVDGTENTMAPGCNLGGAAPWSYTQTVQGTLVISHEPGQLRSLYAHMWKQDMIAKVGDIVSAGDQIAGQGDTGWSCGTHLHIEIYENEVKVDPIPHMESNGIVFPYTLESLPPKPESNNDGGDGGNSEGVDTKYMQHAVKAMKDKGISSSKSEQSCLAKLWNRESNWRTTALNPAFAPSQPPIPEYQAYGIPQSGPGAKMASEGADWKTNAETQIKWGIGYIRDRYGSACNAWAHSEANNWY